MLTDLSLPFRAWEQKAVEDVGQDVTELRSFQPGVGKVDPWRSGGPTWAEYYHADMIGTTRFMTDFIGDPGEDTVFTAFGERIDGTPRRFGYAGSWGYQSTLDDGTPPTEVFPFLHVGARYYDPATGRFLQRDPIGIVGGLNVYEYVGSSPGARVDPSGLHDGGPSHWGRMPPNPPSPPPGTVPINPGWPDDPESPVYPYDEMEFDRDVHVMNAFGCFVGLGAVGFLGEGVAWAAWIIGSAIAGWAASPVG